MMGWRVRLIRRAGPADGWGRGLAADEPDYREVRLLGTHSPPIQPRMCAGGKDSPPEGGPSRKVTQLVAGPVACTEARVKRSRALRALRVSGCSGPRRRSLSATTCSNMARASPVRPADPPLSGARSAALRRL